MKQIIKLLDEIKTNKISNYVIAGLDSYMVSNGKVRLFENSRNHQDAITPHSHRFNFACMVLQGHVTNRIWSNCRQWEGDLFMISELNYHGDVGHHTVVQQDSTYFNYIDNVYKTGECYSMKSEQIHSIYFSKDAKVLFFEGATLSNTSVIIEPIVNEIVIPTYKQEDYMFLKDYSETK